MAQTGTARRRAVAPDPRCANLGFDELSATGCDGNRPGRHPSPVPWRSASSVHQPAGVGAASAGRAPRAHYRNGGIHMADVERMYIDGEWVLAEGGATFDVTNPADRTVVARGANGAGPEIQRAVTAAHAAFRAGSVLAPNDRGCILLKIQQLMQDLQDQLLRLERRANSNPCKEG